MRHIVSLIIPAVLLLVVLPASASDIPNLAACTTRIFKEINRNHAWSGKAPEGCPDSIAVGKEPNGLLVTVWVARNVNGEWNNTAFSAAMEYAEIAVNKDLVKACGDIITRAGRLGRCLDSLISVNDPLECRYRANKSYMTGEETGTKGERFIWLDDNGRQTVVEYSFGDTTATPSPPAELSDNPPLPPSMIIDLHLHKRGKGNTGDFTGAIARSFNNFNPGSP